MTEHDPDAEPQLADISREARPTRAGWLELHDLLAKREQDTRRVTELLEVEREHSAVYRDRTAPDPEAELLAAVERAVDQYGAAMRELARQAQANSRDTWGPMEGISGGYAERDPQPYQPALDSPLGRVLVHVAHRHGVKLEATTVFPEPRPVADALVAVPHRLAEQLAEAVRRGDLR
jgi:hypothetical protein